MFVSVGVGVCDNLEENEFEMEPVFVTPVGKAVIDTVLDLKLEEDIDTVSVIVFIDELEGEMDTV
jgi:hypothetical protein